MPCRAGEDASDAGDYSQPPSLIGVIHARAEWLKAPRVGERGEIRAEIRRQESLGMKEI